MQVSNSLFQGLDFKDFEIQDFLSSTSNLSCDIACSTNIRTLQKFLIKILTISEESQESRLITELNILDKLNSHPFKPKSLPTYYGFAKEEEQGKTTRYNVVYERMEINFRKMIKAKSLKHEFFPFEFILDCFNSLVNTLAFLQNSDICPTRLDSDGLFLNYNERVPKIIDFSTKKDFFFEVFRDSSRNFSYLPPELSSFKEKEEEFHSKDKINPYKVVVFSFGILMLELMTFEIPKSHKTLDADLQKLIVLATQRYTFLKDSPLFKGFMQIIGETILLNGNERIDCQQLFWKNAEMRNSLVSNHLMHHIFIEDGNCSDLKLFNELKMKGKEFKLHDLGNTNDEIFGLGQKILEKEFTNDENALKSLLSEVKPLRCVNFKTLRGNIDKDYRFFDEIILNKEYWDIETFPIKSIIVQANVHEKLIDDEYKKYYYNVFIKPAIKSAEYHEEGAIKILHEHDWNFMEGVYDEQLEPLLESLRVNFVKNNKKLEKLYIIIQSFHRITENTAINIKKLLNELEFENLKELDFGYQLKVFKNQDILVETFQTLSDKLSKLSKPSQLTRLAFSVNTWDVQNNYLDNLSQFLLKLKNLKELDLNLKEITKDNLSLQSSFPEALKATLPNLTNFSLALRSEEKPFLDDESLKNVSTVLRGYLPKKMKSFSFFFDSGGVLEHTIEILYEIIKERTFNCVNFCYRSKYQVHELKSSLVQRKFQQALQKNKALIKIGAMQFLFCGLEKK